MGWSAFGSLGRIVHPFLPSLGPARRAASTARIAPTFTLIQPLHVERAHARAHPVHAEVRNRPGTEFIVTVARGPVRTGAAPDEGRGEEAAPHQGGSVMNRNSRR